MTTKLKLLAICQLLTALCLSVHAQGTAFTYQGRLNDGANLANGSYDLRFAIYDALTAGTQQGSLITNSATAVSNGLFTVTLDFGNQFPGAGRWLEIAVRTNAPAAFTVLAPRQALTPAPYAVMAGNLVSNGLAAGSYGSALTLNNAANSFNGSYTGNGGGLTNVNAVTLGGLASSNFWQLGGNNVAPGSFFGSTNNQAVEFRTANQRALRLELTADSPNVIGGASINVAGPDAQGSTIAGGGSVATYGGAFPNRVDSYHDTIGGGLGNWIQTNAYEATIAGGNQNFIQAGAYRCFIGGGIGNVIQSNAYENVLSGGVLNQIGAGAYDNFVGGGRGNFIQTNAAYATIGGGFQNTNGAEYTGVIGGGNYNLIRSGIYPTISGGGQNVVNGTAATVGGGVVNNAVTNYAVVCGGGLNTASGSAAFVGGGGVFEIGGGVFYQEGNTASGTAAAVVGGLANTAGGNGSFVGGGSNNVIRAGSVGAAILGGWANQVTNNLATVIGGAGNVAGGAFSMAGGFTSTASGNYSFAMGTQAKALHDGAFVWADEQFANFASTAANQFCIRAQGGVILDNSTPAINFGTQTRQMLNLYQAGYAIGVQNFATYFRSGSDFCWFKGGTHSDTQDDPGTGGSRLMLLNAGGLTVNGTFVSASDRNLKENFQPVNAQEVLAKVAVLPLSRWNYKEDKTSEHLGPMAQDFYGAFGVGPDDKHITTVDEGGVALAAIQGLNEKLEGRSKKAEGQIEALQAENAELKQELNAIKRMLQQLTTRKH